MEIAVFGKSELYARACSAAISLIEATNTLLKTQGSLNAIINDYNNPQLVSDLQHLIQNYEQVYMIVNVIRSVQSFIDSDAERASLTNAANSASSTSLTVLHHVYVALSNNPNQEIAELVNNKIRNLMKQNENFKDTMTAQAPPTPAPAPTPTPVPTSEPAVTQEDSMQVDQPDHTSYSHRTAPPATTENIQINQQTPKTEPLENMHIEEPSSTPAAEQAAPEPKSSNEQLTTSKFLEGFEITARNFRSKSNLHIDMFWESMFTIAVPVKYLEWVKANLFGKNLNWETAKRLYMAQFPDAPPQSPPVPSRRLEPEKPVVRESVVIQPKGEAGESRQRMMFYAERLLSLEMKVSEDIDAYNQKYLRYCRVAKIDLNDSSLQRRYTGSLLPDYRALVMTAVRTPPRGLEEYMKIVSLAIRSVEGGKPMTLVKPYNKSCSHGQQNYLDKPPNKRTYPYGGESSSKRKAL